MRSVSRKPSATPASYQAEVSRLTEVPGDAETSLHEALRVYHEQAGDGACRQVWTALASFAARLGAGADLTARWPVSTGLQQVFNPFR
jgi:hypothetical protein